MDQNSFFENFRRSKSFDSKARLHPKIYFLIDFDDFGAFLSVVDAKGKKIETDYLAYGGATRNVLRSIEQIQEKNSFLIDWERPTDRIYLSDHNYLTGQLKRTGNVVNKDLEKLSFAKGTGHIRIKILPKDTDNSDLKKDPLWISHTELVLEENVFGQFLLLNEETAIVGRQLIEIEPLGDGFQNILFFKTELNETDFSVFLSLLFSYLDNIELVFQDYTVQEVDEKVFASPILIFEKVDVDDALFMRVGQTLPNMDVSVLDQLDLFRYAEINEMEKIISVKYIEQEPIEEVIRAIGKLLKKHAPKGRKDNRAEYVLENDLFIIPQEMAAGFIYNELPELLAQFQVFGAEKLKSYKVSAVQPVLSVNLAHGIDFLEGEVTLDFGDEKIDLFEVLAQLKKNRYVKLTDGSHALVNEAYLKRLERIFTKKGKNKAQLSFFDLPLVEDLIKEKVSGNEFKKSRDIFEGFNNLKSKRYRLPDLNATLRPYQKDGFKWLKYLQDNTLGGCLADDMGLGKTLQAIAVLATVYPNEKLPSLIVMPRSLLFNWRAEVKRFAPQLSTHTLYGLNRDLAEAKKANLIFTTYATMRNDIEALKEEKFLYIILDESQNIKNIQAQTTKAAMLLNAKHRLALSGTPIENNLGELYSLFRFLNPSMFGSLQRFNQNYLAPIQKNNDKFATRQLRKKIYPFVLRRLKKDVLKDLPDKIEQTFFVEMSEKQRRLYEQRRQFYQVMVRNQIAEKRGCRFALFHFPGFE